MDDIKSINLSDSGDKKDSLFKRIDYKLYSWYYDSWLMAIYQYSWLYNLKWHITHWWRKDHWIKTNLEIGYHDKPELIEDGLFSLVENYVSRDDEDAPSIILMDDEFHKDVIDILHFYKIRKPELMKRQEFMQHEIFGTCILGSKPCEREGFHELTMTYNDPYTDEERKVKMKECRELENQIHEETQKMLMKVIAIRPRLWS